MFRVYGTSEINEAVARIRADSSLVPAVGLVLGSGLKSLAEEVAEATVVPFSHIPNFPSATVATKLSAVLCRLFSADFYMLSNHLNAPFVHKLLIRAMADICFIANNAIWDILSNAPVNFLL